MNLRILKFKILRNIIYFFMKNLSIKNNRILFSAFKGKQYACNPKSISEYLLKNGNIDYEIIWVNRGGKNFPQNIKSVEYMSLKFIYYYFTSKWVITNDGFKNDFKKPKGQYRLQTWHGGGAYKKVNHRINDFRRYRCEVVGNDIDYFISSCTKFSDVMSVAHYVNRGKFLEVGMPRNDVFFDVDKVRGLKEKVTKLLKLKACKIVLYAPTWRDNGAVQEIGEIYEAIKILNKYTNQQYCLLCRAHHYGKVKGVEEGIIDVTNYPDMQELLCTADILITDYSSCMWDFSLMYKPCFIYATDLEYYEQERDFYTPISEWPFPVASNAVDLANNIMRFNKEKYLSDVRKHHAELGICEDGHACEKICRLIEKKCCEKV